MAISLDELHGVVCLWHLLEGDLCGKLGERMLKASGMHFTLVEAAR